MRSRVFGMNTGGPDRATFMGIFRKGALKLPRATAVLIWTDP